MTIRTFFLLRAGLKPHMKTFFVSFEVAAKEPAVAIPLKYRSATLTGYAVVVALPSEVLTIIHGRWVCHNG